MSSEKTYRFISDPGHKENLSGRVRAACLTCRRKKVKCDGEVPCGPCEEKGVVCEGHTERRRPKKNSERPSRPSSTRRGSEEGNMRSTRSSLDCSSTRVDWDDEHMRRPTARLRKSNTTDSEDSGYASGAQVAPETMVEQMLQLDTPFDYSHDLGRNASPFNASSSISPASYNLNNEVLPNLPRTASTFASGPAGLNMFQSGRADSVPEPLISFQGLSHNEFAASSWTESATSCQGLQSTGSSAQASEAPPPCLRRLAAYPHLQVTNDTRRQTVTFPMYNEIGSPEGFSNPFAFAAYDDLALLSNVRGPSNSDIPLPSGFDSWWDGQADYNAALSLDVSLAPDMLAGGLPTQSGIATNQDSWGSAPGPCISPVNVNATAQNRDSTIWNGRVAPPRSLTPITPRGRSRHDYALLYPWPE